MILYYKKSSWRIHNSTAKGACCVICIWFLEPTLGGNREQIPQIIALWPPQRCYGTQDPPAKSCAYVQNKKIQIKIKL